MDPKAKDAFDRLTKWHCYILDINCMTEDFVRDEPLLTVERVGPCEFVYTYRGKVIQDPAQIVEALRDGFEAWWDATICSLGDQRIDRDEPQPDGSSPGIRPTTVDGTTVNPHVSIVACCRVHPRMHDSWVDNG